MAQAKTDDRSFNKRLMDAMAEMENPTKSKTATVPTKNGKEYHYNYETLDEVLGIVRPALTKHGLMLFQTVKWDDKFNGFVLVTGVFGETDSRAMDTRPFHTCDDAQAEGSWETYIRRYAIRTAFGLTGEDDDGAATLNSKSNAKGRPVTDKQMDMMLSLIDELSMMRSQPIETVREAIAKVIGVEVSDMTSKQASEAIEQLLAWKDKAMKEMKDELQEMYDEDVDF